MRFHPHPSSKSDCDGREARSRSGRMHAVEEMIRSIDFMNEGGIGSLYI